MQAAGTEEVRDIAVFFYFSLLNEKLAIEASRKVVIKFNNLLKRNPDLRRTATIIHITNQVWSQFHKKNSEQGVVALNKSRWILPENVDLGPWRQFRKESETNELLITIWSQILGYSHRDIANGLNVSEGTVNHRVGRSLRHLGAMYKLDALND